MIHLIGDRLYSADQRRSHVRTLCCQLNWREPLMDHIVDELRLINHLYEAALEPASFEGLL
ncbi:MAG: hypothetical protein AAFO68_04285, partial [Pseudomonadota bacterium]